MRTHHSSNWPKSLGKLRVNMAAVILSCVFSARLLSQAREGIRIDVVEIWILGGVSPERIWNRDVKESGLSFALDSETESRLRSRGATDEMISMLKRAKHVASSGAAIRNVTDSAPLSSHATTPPAPNPNLAEQAFRNGTELYDRGAYSEAALQFTKASSQGHSDAAGFLGFMYMQGKGVPINGSKAITYLTLSADAGTPAASYNLGDIYWDGIGAKKDNKLAAYWFGKALQGYLKQAISGDVEAMTMAGRIYAEGGGTKSNPAEALRWLEEAASRNYPKGQRILGELYLRGLRVQKNRVEGIRLLQLAARAGDRIAQELLRAEKVIW